MTLSIFTLVEHIEKHGKYYGYAPYVREMDIWNSHFKEIIIVAPLSEHKTIDEITIPYKHPNISFVEVPVFNVKSIGSVLHLLKQMPSIVSKMYRTMRRSHHIHFRSPSNVVAIASIVQMFFPKKKKTMRYTGNWDPKSKQPLGYRFQKSIFSNTTLSRNISVLVYGNWKNQSKHVKPFFTATFRESEKEEFLKRDYTNILRFVYSGALVPGKQPLLALRIIEHLRDRGVRCVVEFYGEGILRDKLEEYIATNNLNEIAVLHGNKEKEVVKVALKNSHFTILPSKSEGWPKAIAEGMFFGSIPIATNVSCIDWMLKDGKRGILISEDLNENVDQIFEVIKNGDLSAMSKAAQIWSHQYTVEKQTEEIKNILAT